MSEQNAAMTARSLVNILTSIDAAPAVAPDQSAHRATAAQITAEHWAGRTLWLLVTVTSLWDIAVTFELHFKLPKQLFYASLAH